MMTNLKKMDKRKLEHKLHTARFTPEPIFDLSECGIAAVPKGVFSLCRVLRKEKLNLNGNNLSSLDGGGDLKDLVDLKILDIQHNSFINLPVKIYCMKNLQELYVNNNNIQKLPESIVQLSNLIILDVAYNELKELPNNIGELHQLQQLRITGNTRINTLPKSFYKMKELRVLEIDDPTQFIYPPKHVMNSEVQSIIDFIYSDYCESNINNLQSNNKVFSPQQLEKSAIKTKIIPSSEIKVEHDGLASASDTMEMKKLYREKLLAEISKQETILNNKLYEVQSLRAKERAQILNEISSLEENCNKTIKKFLEGTSCSSAQLLEMEKQLEENLVRAAKRNEAIVAKQDVIENMQKLLQQEEHLYMKYNRDRLDSSKSVLEQQAICDKNLFGLLQFQDTRKKDLLDQLQYDENLQQKAVETLLEHRDLRSWGIKQQVRLIEKQLADITNIEINRKRNEVNKCVNDFVCQRLNLTEVLMNLLKQQQDRKLQLMSTIERIQEHAGTHDFWLQQYQKLLTEYPNELLNAQQNMDPLLIQALLENGVISWLPFLARLTQMQCFTNVTEADLIEIGIPHVSDRQRIRDAFQIFKKQKSESTSGPVTNVPPCIEEASAPPLEEMHTIETSECVICMDNECRMVFIPCGHLCTCTQCADLVTICPLCRGTIEHVVMMTL